MSLTRREFLSTAGSALALGSIGSATSAPQAIASPPAPATGEAGDICFASARELARKLRKRELSAREVMAAHLRQIAKFNPRVNAIVAPLSDEQSLALADDADRRLARGDEVGPLHGLPFAFKDSESVVGFPYTRGSPILKHNMPTEDSVVVERIRRAGALPIGKTNVPEFAMGSQSYNNVYGTTLNPYHLEKCAGGSSGGAAVSLATGMQPLANGSDLAGSLRNPGNFNNVVGFRPTVGLVPLAPVSLPFAGLVVKGPLARSVSDVAFLLSVMAGADARDPGGYPSDPSIFNRPLERELKGLRVAWSPNLGTLPLDPQVRAVLEKQRATFERLGCIVEDAVPDLTGADEVFLTLRRWMSWNTMNDLLASHRAEIKPEAVEEIEQGSKYSGADIAQALIGQAQIMDRMRIFQEKYPILLSAVNQVPPFAATLHWPHEIGEVKMEHYIAWMKSAYWITVTSCPAISVPAGFTPEGLPVGIQIVGRYRADFEVLQVAHMFENATRFGLRRPTLPT